jgi:hypothetical protein
LPEYRAYASSNRRDTFSGRSRSISEVAQDRTLRDRGAGRALSDIDYFGSERGSALFFYQATSASWAEFNFSEAMRRIWVA